MSVKTRNSPQTPPHRRQKLKAPPPLLSNKPSATDCNSAQNQNVNDMKETFQFSIEVSAGNWRLSPEYPSQEACFAAALRCTKKLGQQFQRVTFMVNKRYEESKKKV